MSVVNHGAALGQCIGVEMGKAIDDHLSSLCREMSCHYICESSHSGNLYLYGKDKTSYQIDAVIVDDECRPLIVLESKYIRYTKHNRDKASWICSTSDALHKNYHTIRKFIAVLAGNWSDPSIAMMNNKNIETFIIPFNLICSILSLQKISFNWKEKDRDSAIHAYMTYVKLSDKEKQIIGKKMISAILPELDQKVRDILREQLAISIDKTVIELHSNLEERRLYSFNSVTDAVSFLEKANAPEIFSRKDAKTFIKRGSKVAHNSNDGP